MRNRARPDHQEAVSRRLALLSAELAAVRPEPPIAEEDDWSAPHTRVRPGPLGAVPAPVGEPEDLPVVPVPGRHASRRRVLAGLVPETLRGRAGLGPGHLAVVALVVALGLAVTCWWLVRGGSSAVVAPALPTQAAALVTSGPSTGATPPVTGPAGPMDASGPAGTVTVDVAGKVRRPGIVVLDTGSRVVDAVTAAGGARRGVDLAGLNLARLLVDGEQILVGTAAPVGLAASADPGPGAPAGPLVNINTASESELETLPEVGPVTAQAILQWRSEHGGFSSVDELLEVDGIGDATLGKLAPYVTV
jgi:competence protein ComEA